MSNTNNPPTLTPASQTAAGTGIAQVIGSGSATVNYYALARPRPVSAAELAQACAQLEALPLDGLPDPAPLPSGSRMPHSRNPLFVGRADELRQLARLLKGGGTAAIGPVGATAAATGLGGVGKTQLAVEFAHRYGQYFFGGVFWISLASRESVPAEVAQCGGAGGLDLRADFGNLKLDEQVAAVLAEWQSGLPRLLVFDNCEDPALLAQWRPPTGGSRVLVTSRRADWEPALGVRALALDVLERAESIALLFQFRPDLTGANADLGAVAAELGDLPLALHLAGSYLRQYRHSPLGRPGALLEELRRPARLEHPALQGAGAQISPTGHAHHVFRTFALSYEQLQPADATDALACQALARAACFAPGEFIPRELLTGTLGAKRGEQPEAARRAEDALARLVSLGLVEDDARGALRLHRLLAAFVQQATLDADAFDAVAETLMGEASRIIDTDSTTFLRPWAEHLRHVAERAEARAHTQSGILWNKYGVYLCIEADYTRGREALERALKIDEAVFGPDHPNVATDANDLGLVLLTLDDYAGARAAYERALKIDETAFGPNHPNVARDLSGLGYLLKDLGDYIGARAACERALKIYETAFGPNHPKVGYAIKKLGGVSLVLGDHVAARAAYEHALEIDEAAFGPNHPQVALSLVNLGYALLRMNDYARAKDAFGRALEIREVVLGPNHPSVAAVVAGLGSALSGLGNYGEARVAYERVLKITEATRGLQHPEFAMQLGNFGETLVRMCDYAGAKDAFQRALTIYEVAVGFDHRYVARTANDLGELLYITGDYTGARAAFERALKIGEATFGLEHPDVARSVNNLGKVMQAQGDLAGARAAYERALRIDEAALGPEHPSTRTVRNNLKALPTGDKQATL